MTININYSKKKTSGKVSGNTVFFVNEKFNTSGLKKYVSASELSYINDLLKNQDSKKKNLCF